MATKEGKEKANGIYKAQTLALVRRLEKMIVDESLDITDYMIICEETERLLPLCFPAAFKGKPLQTTLFESPTNPDAALDDAMAGLNEGQ
jgi:hypothetical protein